MGIRRVYPNRLELVVIARFVPCRNMGILGQRSTIRSCWCSFWFSLFYGKGQTADEINGKMNLFAIDHTHTCKIIHKHINFEKK